MMAAKTSPSFLYGGKHAKPASICPLSQLRTKQRDQGQIYMVGRRAWACHVQPCQVPGLRHAIQRQDGQIEPDKYHSLFRRFIRTCLLRLRRSCRSQHPDEQLNSLSGFRFGVIFACDKKHQTKDVRHLTMDMVYDNFVSVTNSFTEKQPCP